MAFPWARLNSRCAAFFEGKLSHCLSAKSWMSPSSRKNSQCAYLGVPRSERSADRLLKSSFICSGLRLGDVLKEKRPIRPLPTANDHELSGSCHPPPSASPTNPSAQSSTHGSLPLRPIFQSFFQRITKLQSEFCHATDYGTHMVHDNAYSAGIKPTDKSPHALLRQCRHLDRPSGF